MVQPIGGASSSSRGLLRDTLRVELDPGGIEPGRAHGGGPAVERPADQCRVSGGEVASWTESQKGRARDGDRGRSREVREGGRGGREERRVQEERFEMERRS